MTRILFINFFIFYFMSTSLAQIHKEELESRIKEYYLIQAQDYPNTEAHVKAIKPYIIPTSEGEAYARYVVSTWEKFKSENPSYKMTTEISRITQGTTDKIAIVTTVDQYVLEGKYGFVITSTSEWVYQNKQWYRSAKKSIRERTDN
jgi:hypothetical protein